MSNTGGALDGLFALEDRAAEAHKRVAECLEGIRVLLDRAIVKRYGKLYQIAQLRAYRGIVQAGGYRRYPDGTVGVREYDLGDLRGCQILAFHDVSEPPLKIHVRKPRITKITPNRVLCLGEPIKEPASGKGQKAR